MLIVGLLGVRSEASKLETMTNELNEARNDIEEQEVSQDLKLSSMTPPCMMKILIPKMMPSWKNKAMRSYLRSY